MKLLSAKFFSVIGVIGIHLMILTATEAFSCADLEGGFLPDNDLVIPVPPPNASGFLKITEVEFNRVLDKVERAYAPIARSKGANLQIIRDWQNGTVNAFAEQQGNTWIVKMFGGLARHSEITSDGFALIACHEVGHHLGGVPRYQGQWAATEGQSDYFATLKCLRRIWDGEDHAAAIRRAVGAIGGTDAVGSVPTVLTQQCERSFQSRHDIELCERTSLAGMSAARLSAALGNFSMPQFDRKDPTQVAQTYERHPQAQCRLDTYVSGSVCQKRYEEEIGPNDPITGACAEEAGETWGVRPRCWYRPEGNITPPRPTPTPGPSPTPGPQPDPGTHLPIALQPRINGQTDILITNPYMPVYIQYNVSNIPGAAGVYIEILQAGREFQNPHSTTPDPSRLVFGTQAGVIGSGVIVPSQNLPAWGVYRYRIIALDRTGRVAVSRGSSASSLRVQPPQRVAIRMMK